MSNRTIVGLVAGVIALVIALGLLGSSFTVVDTRHTAVLTQFGQVAGELHQGFHTKSPFQSTVDFNTGEQVYQEDVTASTSDLQNVSGPVAINFHLDAAHVMDIFNKVGEDFVGIVIAPNYPNQIKTATAQFTAQEMIQQRAKVERTALALLQGYFAPYHIIIDSVSLKDLQFSAAFTQAIEAKQVAQQNLLRVRTEAQQKVAQAQADAQAAIAQAQGQAQAKRINADAQAYAQKVTTLNLTPQYLQYQQILRWNGQLPTYQFGSGPTPTFPVKP